MKFANRQNLQKGESKMIPWLRVLSQWKVGESIHQDGENNHGSKFEGEDGYSLDGLLVPESFPSSNISLQIAVPQAKNYTHKE